MSLLFDLVKAFGFGVMAFVVFPIVAAFLPWSVAKGIIGRYQQIAMQLIGRGLLLMRSHGGLSLKKSTYDARLGAEKVWLGREKQHFFDPHDYQATFKGYPFGLAHEDRAVVIDCRTAYFGRVFRELVQNERSERDGMLKAYFAVPEGVRQLVNIADALPVIQNPARPNVTDRIDSYAEKGQSLFNSRADLVSQAQWFIALVVGVGVVWGLKQLATSGAADIGRTLPIFIGLGAG